MAVNGQLLGLPSPWAQGIIGAFPDEYALPYPTFPARIVRKTVKRDVNTAMPITPLNPLVRFTIPTNNQTICDFRRAKVYITFSVGVTAPWFARPSPLAWNIVQRFRLEQGGQYVEDRRYWNWQETLVYVVQTHINQQMTTGVALYGDGSTITRNARAAGWTYCLPIPSTALTKGVLPWWQTKKDNLNVYNAENLPDTTLQWEFEPPENFVEVYGAAPATPIVGLTWTITRMVIEYEEIYAEAGNKVLISQWLSKSQRSVVNGFPRVYYRSFLSNTYSMTTNTDQTILIDFKLASIISIYVTFRYANRVNNPEIYSKHSDYLSRGDFNMSEYQFNVNGCLWPDRPVGMIDPGLVDAYAKYLESWQMFHGRGINQEVTPITIDQFLSDKFLCVFDGNQHPFSSMMVNNVSTSYSGNSIQLQLKFAANPPAGLEALVHIFHWRVWNFGARAGTPVFEN